jgi:hypothetical protein
MSTPIPVTPVMAALAGQAADVLKQRGHAKYVLQDDVGCVCVSGALNVADHGNPMWDVSFIEGSRVDAVTVVLDKTGTVLAVLHAIADRVPEYQRAGTPHTMGAVYWNNAPATTADEVITMLRDISLSGETQ